MSRKTIIPSTPLVMSPSPTPSEMGAPAAASSSNLSAYTGPVTRAAARRRLTTPQPEVSDVDNDDVTIHIHPDQRRSRTRSRSPIIPSRLDTATDGAQSEVSRKKSTKAAAKKKPPKPPPSGNRGDDDGDSHLSPSTPTPAKVSWSWRDFSRSPSPLGLIPIHRHWRTSVHKHEVPRKVLHASIGFFVIWLYLSGTQTSAVCPYLMSALVPILGVDMLRHHSPSFNRIYVKVLGLLMRESEFSGYNGVIFYLAGAWTVLYFFPKDVGVMGTMLLSWCDTAASTFGRLYGGYTPRLRRGKSLAGSMAAFLVGAGTAAWFWGWLAPTKGPMPGDDTFMFHGVLRLPHLVREALGWSEDQATVGGGLALGVVSVWTGFVAAASEVVDLMSLDDNLTIPMLSGFGLWGFLRIFG